jgi:hypothetical protein
MGRFIDLSGQIIGNLHVIKRVEAGNGDTYWICECCCGNEIKIRVFHIEYQKLWLRLKRGWEFERAIA